MRLSARSTWTCVVVFLCAVLASGTLLAARDTTAKLEARLARAKDPAQRARIAAKLGTLELEELSAAYHDGRYEQGGALLKKFLDGVEEADRGLATLAVKPRRKSKGFKELEICVRESIRQLRDLATMLSVPDREPLEAAIHRLEKVQNNLLNALFQAPEEKPPRKVK